MTVSLGNRSLPDPIPHPGWPGRWVIRWEPPLDWVHAVQLLDTIHSIPPDTASIQPDPSSSMAVLMKPSKIPENPQMEQNPSGACTISWPPPDSESARETVQRIFQCREILATTRSIQKDTGRFIPATALIYYLTDPRDIRWRSAGLPVASLLLAGIAKRHGHHAMIRDLPISGPVPVIPENVNIVMLTLFEDQFIECRNLIRGIRHRTNAWIALGGPMPTLAPTAVAVHLPDANIVFRGEAEEMLPEILNYIRGTFPDSATPPFPRHPPNIPGILIRTPSTLISSSLDQRNEVRSFQGGCHDYDSLKPISVRNGIEVSTSRGCPRRCTFCSHVHGTHVRQIPLEILDGELTRYTEHLRKLERENGPLPESAWTVNINDDDILLNPDRCRNIIQMLLARNLRLWGVQTSLGALQNPSVRERALGMFSRPELYPNGQPVFWIGTDAFIADRLKRLGKSGSSRILEEICRDLSELGIQGFHYWIVTDAKSTWKELFQELLILIRFRRQFPVSFFVLPNAAATIPYPGTYLFHQRIGEGLGDRVLIREFLDRTECPAHGYPLVLHERPESSYLYAFTAPAAHVPERLIFQPREFIRNIRSGQFEQAFAMAIQAARREMDDTTSSPHRKKLERILLDMHTQMEVVLTLGDFDS